MTRKTSGAAGGAKRKGAANPGRSSDASRSRNGIFARITGRISRAVWFVRRAVRALVRFLLLATFWLVWRLALLGAIIFACSVFYYHAHLPELSQLLDARVRGSVTFIDRNNEVFAWRGEQFGGVVAVEHVSEHLKNAIIATEDKRFYRHFGISPRGIASAVRINLSEGRGALQGHGGSTITQQVAKLMCMGRKFDPMGQLSEAEFERDCRRNTLWRKITEVPFSVAMEIKYTKDEILTIYLNRAYLGAGSRGFAAASQRYFGKPPSSVSAAEAAMLAGLLVAPSRYAPTRNLMRAQQRAGVIINLMEEQGLLTEEEADNARVNPARLSRAAASRAGGYFADWVMESSPSFLTRGTTEDVVIRTTFDSRIQQTAEEALSQVFATKVKEESRAQAAIVVMSREGAVRAMVGGRENATSGQFNRATQALRQTGSSFKPFVYAAALEAGFRPDYIVDDSPVAIPVAGSGTWRPRNYKDEYYGRITLTEALAKSANAAAVKVAESVGRDRVRSIARSFGVAEEFATGPAISLGASESTLLNMTGAYAGIANGGIAVTPYGVIQIELKNDRTPLIDGSRGRPMRVISPRSGHDLVSMLHAVVEDGTAMRARLDGHQAAGKTGTTQAARDAWFIGFTAHYVTGVWMGYDDNTPLTGVTGGGLPADIWRETMVRVHEDLEPVVLEMADPFERAGTDVVADDAGSSEEDGTLMSILRDLFGAN